MLPMSKCNVETITWPCGFVSTGLIFMLLLCNLSCAPAPAKADAKNENKKDDGDGPSVKFSNGKKIYTDYSVIGKLHILTNVNLLYSHTDMNIFL